MPRNLDGLNILRYIRNYREFIDQAEEEETVIEPDPSENSAYNLNGYCLGDLEVSNENST